MSIRTEIKIEVIVTVSVPVIRTTHRHYDSPDEDYYFFDDEYDEVEFITEDGRFNKGDIADHLKQKALEELGC